MDVNPLPAGTRVGPFLLVRPLGRGANATVYLARRGEREVALKLRQRGEAELDRRFLREFEALRGLSLPGVVRVYDAGVSDPWIWYAMRPVEGLPLRSWVEEAPDLDARVERVLSVGARVCDALAGIHRAGMIHRDLKPGNVLVDRHGQPHILDFGVVRWFRGGDPLTGQGGLVGTLPFMAPEQIAGIPLTSRADVFAVGLMLYEGITGKRPRPPRPQDWLRIQCLERPRPLAVGYPSVPRALSALIDAMLALDPLDRPEAHEAAERFRACARGQAPAPWPEPSAWVGTSPTWSQPLAGEPVVRILAGPVGSGRRRTAEQVRRKATLAGVRTLRGRCRVEVPGGAIVGALETLLEEPSSEEWRSELEATDAATLLEMWPFLPMRSAAPRAVESPRDLVAACAHAFASAASHAPLLLVIEDLDEVDALTARVLEQLARTRPAGLAVLATYDDRWAIRRGKKLVDGLVADGHAHLAPMPDLSREEAAALAASLLPDGTHLPPTEAGAPLRAVESAWGQLANVRREKFGALTGPATDVALVDAPVHRETWRALGVDPNTFVPRGALSAIGGDRWRVNTWVRRPALARLANRAVSARRLADALDRDPHAATVVAGARARARLLAGETAAALVPAAQAALHAEATGDAAAARDWLNLVDTLPRTEGGEGYVALRFALARCRVGIAAMTGSERARADLLALAAARATSPSERAEVELMRAEHRRREGDGRGALARCLRLASAQGGAPPEVAARALLVAAEIRVDLGQHDDALPLLDRLRDMTASRATGRLEIQATQLRAEVAIARGELEEALRLARAGAAHAVKLGDRMGLARCYQRLGHASLLVGDRVAADEAEVAARRQFVSARARLAAAEAGLHLGELALGRGDAPSARRFAEEALGAGTRLGGARLARNARALLLEVAVVTADDLLAERMRDESLRDSVASPAWDVAWQRWARAFGDGQALALPATGQGYRAALLAIEIARTHAERGHPELAAAPLQRARLLAHGGSYRELSLYAEVVAGEVHVLRDDTWARTLTDALACKWTEITLHALAVDAVRTWHTGQRDRARERAEELHMRADEQAHAPASARAARLLAAFRS